METITISTKNHETYSSVSNFFIDYYMTEANGEYVKVYLYLVRLLNSNRAVTVAEIADHFDSTEKDICRAIKYWIKQKAIKLEYTSDKVLTGITLLPLTARATKNDSETLLSMLGVDTTADIAEDSDDTASYTDAASTKASSKKRNTSISAGSRSRTLDNSETETDTDSTEEKPEAITVPKKVKYTPAYINEKQEDDDFGNILYQTETYFGKPLTQSDAEKLLYIYEELNFTPELLEYLVEYCVSIGKKSCRYIEAVAIEWFKNGITTVEDAKIASKNYNSIYMSVLKQLGIPNRVPTPDETRFIDTWYNTYSFNKNIIIEACRRAILNNPQSANFNYVNGILESWYKQNVHTLSDIQKLDEQWAANKKKKQTGRASSNNQFNNYQGSTDDSVVDEFAQLFLKETNKASDTYSDT
ncbi:MAG: DnaD domain protein [Lachnospiraceae bacterium]|nr:DnaD domain protein [Lachnospiraceae bacterium]